MSRNEIIPEVMTTEVRAEIQHIVDKYVMKGSLKYSDLLFFAMEAFTLGYTFKGKRGRVAC